MGGVVLVLGVMEAWWKGVVKSGSSFDFRFFFSCVWDVLSLFSPSLSPMDPNASCLVLIIAVI